MTEAIEDKTMVERIAEAIWAEQKPDGVPGYWDLDFLDQGKIKMIARACIKTMREPTDEMIGPGMETDFNGEFDFIERERCRQVFQNMIDNALQED